MGLTCSPGDLVAQPRPVTPEMFHGRRTLIGWGYLPSSRSISLSSLSPPRSGLALHFFTGPRNRQGSFAARINANADDGGDSPHRKRDSDAA